jgi:hypothetical protein
MRGLKGAGAALALSVVLAGCGGDDEDPGAGSEQGATTTAAEPERTTDTPDNDGFCADIEDVVEPMRDLADSPDITDPMAALAALTALGQSMTAIRSIDPPTEIADEWATVVSYVDTVESGLENLNADDPDELTRQLEDLGNRLEDQSAELEAAGMRISDYAEEECGIVLE